MIQNPFSVVSPEELTAEQADQLFVETHSDYPEVAREGNTLIVGARGSGKSMLFRCSRPDFLMVREKKQFQELPYFATMVSVKKTSLNLEDLNRLEEYHIPYAVNEHFLTLHVLMQTFLDLSKIKFTEGTYNREKYQSFFDQVYMRYLITSGCKEEFYVNYDSQNSFFDSLFKHLEQLNFSFIDYVLRLFPDKSDIYFSMPLISYQRFLIPIFVEMMKLPGFPDSKPVFIFIDDADNLSKIQTEILNSWLACRNQPTISLKISSQIGLYKTYLTPSRVLVESPHDYQEVNTAFLYTNRKPTRDYYTKACKILFRRLQIQGYAGTIDVNPENEHQMIEEVLNNYFPAFKKQEEGIADEAKKIRDLYMERGRGNSLDDDVRRYAIPNYIRGLGGPRKSRNTYKYAGLKNVIHLSSGIIRYLLDAVAKMYDTEVSKGNDRNITSISCAVQDEVLRSKADFYLFSELKKSKTGLAENLSISTTTNPTNMSDKLGNLINAMGKTFHEILVSGDPKDPFSGRSERKVFSIALSNPETVDNDLDQVFSLGVRLGFLHEAYIGNKDGTGRTNLYVLNRCFAPIFTLDPTGFQGYLFMTNSDLKTAIQTGKQLRDVSKTLPNTDDEPQQLPFDIFLEEW